MIDDVIKLKVRHSFTLFPRFPAVLGTENNTYGIVKWIVTDVITGNENVSLFKEITITGGYTLELDKTKEYTVLAKEIEHEKYGKQYQLMFIGELTDFSTVQNQKAFLSTILTDNQIHHIYEVSDNPLQTLENHDKDTLVKAWGIGEYNADCILERFEENRDNCEVYMKLDGLGLTPKFIQKLIKKYMNPQKIISIIKNDPYQLCYDVDGIGFKTADNIAMRVGIDEHSPERIMAFINYHLEDIAQTGNSYITSAELTGAIFEEFGGMDEILEMYEENDTEHITSNNVAEAIDKLTKRHILVVEDSDNRAYRKVYLKKYYDIEKAISNHLKRIASAPNKFNFTNWEENVKKQELIQGWTLTEEQKNGVQTCLEKQVSFITGGAGSGKTSVLSCALKALSCMGVDSKYTFAQCSLSGKAAARMSEVTGEEGYTIHRLLGYNPQNGFKYDENNPLPYNIIIVDEISLIGGEIFLSLLKAISTGSKLIILGDMGQLESIGCLNLAHDLYRSDSILTVELTKVHRQAAKSGIITASRSIREQIPLCDNKFTGVQVLGELKDMILDVDDNYSEHREKIMNYYRKFYESGKIKDIMDIEVLLAVRERGEACVNNLNKDIQAYLNPDVNFNKKELVIDEINDIKTVLREGDKVMCIQNNYKTVNDKNIITPIFNGWMGVLKKVDVTSGFGYMYFPIINDTIMMTVNEIRKSIVLGYASTVHKYQGSSSKYIICSVDYSIPPQMLTKELVYTMITRAETECVLVAQNRALNTAIKNSGIEDKNTFLEDFLRM